MRKLIALSALLVSAACGEAPKKDNELVILNGSPAVTDETIKAVIDSVNAIHAVNLDGYSLTVLDDLGELRSGCVGNDNQYGCHSANPKYIRTFWPTEYQDYSKKVINAISAYTLCHEMGHAYYGQTENNTDHNHTHREWFDGNDATSVCGRIYDLFHKDL